MEHFDVVIVGAGLSGIGAAHHLQGNCPTHSYVILEGRDAIGGTWDLFRYPGIRSDSDMFTLGYAFRPWTEAKAIADGPSILKYVRDTASEAGIDRHIRFGHKVQSAEWNSADSTWTVSAESNGRVVRFTCNFLNMCSGYYDYAEGHNPEFEGRERFGGEIVHPQHWPEDLDYADKRVVVIGSGATAVTVVPEMAKTAAHVTMLQRSPTYVVSMPAADGLGERLRRYLPETWVYAISRWLRVLGGMWFFAYCRRSPEKACEMVLKGVRAALPGYDVEKHFTPSYNPWEQRMCLMPDGDLFAAIRDGSASVVTDTIDSFDETGVVLDSGEHLDADVIVTATGLKLRFLANLDITVDGEAVSPASMLIYKGMMFSDVPNLAFTMGYTNASWTLKADLTSEYVCRLLNHMRRHGFTECRAPRDLRVSEEPLIDFSSGYVQRALDILPKQGAVKPWKLNQNYALDTLALRYGAVEDGVLRFGRARAKQGIERERATRAA